MSADPKDIRDVVRFLRQRDIQVELEVPGYENGDLPLVLSADSHTPVRVKTSDAVARVDWERLHAAAIVGNSIWEDVFGGGVIFGGPGVQVDVALLYWSNHRSPLVPLYLRARRWVYYSGRR